MKLSNLTGEQAIYIASLKAQNEQMKTDLRFVKTTFLKVIVGLGLGNYEDGNLVLNKMNKLKMVQNVGSVLMSEEKQKEIGLGEIAPLLTELAIRYKDL